jgi:hypothetical protein
MGKEVNTEIEGEGVIEKEGWEKMRFLRCPSALRFSGGSIVSGLNVVPEKEKEVWV